MVSNPKKSRGKTDETEKKDFKIKSTVNIYFRYIKTLSKMSDVFDILMLPPSSQLVDQ